MENRNITTKIIVCSYDELNEEEKKLIDAAKEATNRSYSPYSRFQVGAAALLSGGTVITGSNQENAAYPSGICAERTTLFYANSQYPNLPVEALAIAAQTSGDFIDHPTAPCGACRQVILETEERYNQPMRIYLYGKKEIYIVESIRSLLPLCFGKKRFAGIGYGKILYISKYRGQLGMKNRFVHFILPSSFPIFVEYIRYGSA